MVPGAAERVNADLEAAGFPRCPGGYMPRSWNRPLSEWAARFEGWLDVPTQKALVVASIFFDFRRVGGLLDLEPLEHLLARAPQRPVFLRLLAKDALLHFRPPPMLLLRLKGADWFEQRFLPAFHPVTVVALLATLVMIFAFQAENIATRLFHVVLIAIPILIQVYFNASLAYGLRLFRVPR